jgi:hypothetical protein
MRVIPKLLIVAGALAVALFSQNAADSTKAQDKQGKRTNQNAEVREEQETSNKNATGAREGHRLVDPQTPLTPERTPQTSPAPPVAPPRGQPLVLPPLPGTIPYIEFKPPTLGKPEQPKRPPAPPPRTTEATPGDDNETSFTRPLTEVRTQPQIGTFFVPILAVMSTAAGGLLGLMGAVVLVKTGLSRIFLARPHWDYPARKFFSGFSRSQPAPEVLSLFQPQTAIESGLISRKQYDALRSEHLVPASFSFSMLMPTLLALVYVTMNVTAEWVLWSAAGVACIVTILLTTFSLDRRHRFRSEYRTLVMQNIADHAPPVVSFRSESVAGVRGIKGFAAPGEETEQSEQGPDIPTAEPRWLTPEEIGQINAYLTTRRPRKKKDGGAEETSQSGDN